MANKFVARKGLISLADSEISGSLSVSNDVIISGDLTANLTGSATTASYVAFSGVDGLNSFSQSAASRLHTQELFSSSLDDTFATEAEVLSISSSLSASLAVDISGSDARLDVLEGKTLVSESIQIADDISGSLGANAELIRSLTATDISGSLGANAELIRSLTAASITGSTTALSESLAGRVGAQELFSSSLDTTNLILSGAFSGSFVGDGSQLSGVTSYTDSDTLAYINSVGVLSGSLQIASDISGSFGDVSGSLSGRVANLESTASNHEARLLRYETSSVLSGSAQIADDISGSLGANATLIRSLNATDISGSLGANATLIRSLTAAGITGSFTSLSGSIASDINTKLNFADTGSFAKTDINNNFGGTQTFESINVNATASFGYVQAVTGSATYIGEQYVVVNASTDGGRFAGIQVYDSESLLQHTASLAWDSLNNKWIYTNASGSTYSGGGLISGPRNTGSIGEETFPTLNYVVRSQGGDHIYNSNIIDNDTTLKLGINTEVTGSLIVSSGITGALTGNASTATSASYATYAASAGSAGSATSASYAATGPFLSSESDTLATVTGRGATTSTASTFSGGLTANILRLTSTTDATVSSTDHAFQAGLTNSTNIIIDNNEVMARNNGAVSALNLNPDGGDITLHNNTTAGTFTIGGNTIWHAGNDGAGSGLDADTVDGIQAASFLRSDADDSASGKITFTRGSDDILEYNGAATGPYFRFKTNGTNNGYIQFTTDSAYFWNDRANRGIRIDSSGPAFYDGAYRTIWHSNNDGAGSGLDADTVDGIQAASFLRSDAEDTATGHIIIDSDWNNGSTYVEQFTIYGTFPSMAFRSTNADSNTGGTWLIHMESDGDLTWYSSTDGPTDNWTKRMELQQGGVLQINGSTVWHTGNDGAGSGLDADLWDGNQFSSFLNQAVLTSSSPTFVGITTTGNSYVGNGNGDFLWVNDELYVGSNDSGDSSFYFGENSSNWYGSRWYWDSSYTHYWYSRYAGTDTLLMYHDTRETTNVYFQRHILPTANNTYNLGSASLGWANIYTNDLHLSNMNKEEGNDIDGTRGDWTIQEGEEHLYIINNRNGKKFKIKLEEVE